MSESIRVLYVDGVSEHAERTATALERDAEAFDVTVATTAEKGLHRLTTEDVDCVVSTYELPDRDGVGLLETVRDRHPALPLILIADGASESVVAEALSAGVTHCISEADADRRRRLAERIPAAVDHRRRLSPDHREVFESIPDGVVVHDADGTVVDVNEAYAAMFGYERRELLDAGLDAILPDETPYSATAARRRVREAADRGPRTFEWPGVTADGERFWTEVHLASTRLDGRDRLLAVVREITDRKERERDLERYRTVINTIPDMAYVMDADLRFAVVNDTLVAETGYDREELLGAHISLLLDDDAIERVVDIRERLRADEGGFGRLETDIETARGDRISCEIRGKFLRDPDGSRSRDTAGIIRDVTERKERERELEAQVTAMHAATDGIAILDADGTYRFVNEAHADIYGYADPEALVDETWRLCYDDDELDRFEGNVMPTLFADGAWRGEAVGIRADGSTFPQELTLSLTDRGRIVCVVRDITERKERERELERQNERLEEFTSVVSHDLRNPLNIVGGRLELARETCDSDHLDRAADALERSVALIEDLRTLARDGNHVGELEPVDLGDLTTRCWRNVPTTDATLITATDRTIRCDPGRLQELLENLMRNSVEHGSTNNRPAADDGVDPGDGGVTVTVGETDGGFYVADDGPGIPADERERVFESGYSTAGGTGFGLSIVRDVANAHGWTIQVTESDAGGARFEITGVEDP
ncbi:hybrid sensor histidine kinase/response regulator [Haloplanus pelagicus]|jgi:PAS domain S-box-containing protein|uniref:hybrid sensor histidine kinase/response regulator n=1 Tax=Haloplanus pelagicus TaxID=2949995 RepID=UPI002040F7EA|nr:PAS domain S-box protein [Haloplanus sp. HW8-1]